MQFNFIQLVNLFCILKPNCLLQSLLILFTIIYFTWMVKYTYHGKGSHKKICVFLLDFVQKWPHPPPLILDIHEVPFVSAHFGQLRGNFCIGLKLKYVPNISSKSSSNLLEPAHPPSPHLMSKRRSN